MIDLLPLLVQKGLLEEKDVSTINEEVASSGRPLDEVLSEHGVSARDILAAKGEHWEIPTRSLEGVTVPFSTLEYIPEESAVHYQVVPIAVVDGALEVGIVDPDNIEALDALNFISAKKNIPFKVFLISPGDYRKVMSLYQGLSGEVGKALEELGGTAQEETVTTSFDLSTGAGGGDDLDETVKRASKDSDLHEEAPVTKIVATVLRSAVEGRASDIHIEPERERVRVRFRVDGVLHTSIVLPPKVQRAVAARVKILAGIKLDERRKPQDGRFSATIGGRKIDFRVSTFPTHFGEKVVMRILDSENGIVSLSQLGMEEDHLAMVRNAIKAPYGLILITGPTGSGKSTTLYAMLNEVDKDTQNVLSLEDPVEYNMAGVSQSQVRPEIGYTFASGLRSVLRQDPDIIMVGEIRDKETAQLAVQAALTGHLVLSTLHTNNAAGAIPRLIDMGVDPYLIAPTLELVIAQRLVRRLPEGSGKPIPITGAVAQMLTAQFADLPPEHRAKLPRGEQFMGIQPSPTCPTGTRGRVGVYEMLSVDQVLEQAILESADEAKVYQIARKNGMLTMKEDAIRKAYKAVVPYEEIGALGGADFAEPDTSVAPVVEVVAEEVPSPQEPDSLIRRDLV